MTRIHWRKACCPLGIATAALLAVSSACAQISLSSAVDLAQRNSTQIRIAVADVQRAIAGVAEARDAFVPNFLLGSSVGYTYGFPVGQPSVYNVGSQSLFYSFSQPHYIRASRAALNAAQLTLKDDRDQVALDCALAYIQLDTDIRELAAFDDEKTDAEKLVGIERDRLNAGVDSRMDKTKAEITAAQIDINRLNTESDANDQRQKLAHLTGLPAASFIPDAKSVPQLPDFSAADQLTTQATAQNAGIQAADANTTSKIDLYHGDKNQNYWPQFGLGIEYNRYAEFNNYNQYYLRFQHNNFDVGVQITFPLFDASRRAKARESAALANRASVEAVQARNQVSEQVESLRHSLDLLKAQQHLAQLQSEYAQEQLQAVQSELKNGTGSPNAAPVSPKDEELAGIELARRNVDALNADLSLMRAQLSLMRTMGSIQDWVSSAPK